MPQPPLEGDTSAEATEQLAAVSRERASRKQSAEAWHRASVLAEAERATSARVRTRQDKSRGMWQAWSGDGPYEHAEGRGEWTTEIGALRRLGNSHKRRSGMLESVETVRPAAGASQKQLDQLSGRTPRVKVPTTTIVVILLAASVFLRELLAAFR